MKKFFLTAAIAAFAASPLMASPSGGHGEDGGHGAGHGGHMAAGMPGHRSKVNRTIKVTMTETDDGGMIFTPSDFTFKKGETVRFKVANKGELDHEFILDTPERNSEHKMEMAAEMETHSSPNSVTLAPGERGEVIWTFSNGGTFEVACLIPGHYESGMHGTVSVN